MAQKIKFISSDSLADLETRANEYISDHASRMYSTKLNVIPNPKGNVYIITLSYLPNESKEQY